MDSDYGVSVVPLPEHQRERRGRVAEAEQPALLAPVDVPPEAVGDPPDPEVQPLAARLRPRTLDEVVGQGDVVGPDTPLRRLLERGELTSMVLWGPPGTGKTTLARVVATHVQAAWQELSAVSAGVKDVRQVVDGARRRLRDEGRRTILFLDEIHRFNKAQQDALLPAVESGEILLIGATTENPFFELNSPLLSRCKLLQLGPLSDDEVETVLERATSDPERGYGGRVRVGPDARRELVASAGGDARAALNGLEDAVASAPADTDGTVDVDPDAVAAALRHVRYDRAGDQHFDQVSALIKSLRGSDPDAAVYWLLRMVEAGEDPRFVARRLVIFASEDVGLADEHALPLAVAAFEALDRVGLPEARHNLVHAAVRLACAPKSNAVARALGAGLEAVRTHPNAPVPPHLRDAHYAGASQLGHGVDYQYPHDHPGAHVAQQYLPDALAGLRVYTPTDHGDEAEIARRLAGWRDHRGDPAAELAPVVDPVDTDDPDKGSDT